MKSNSVVNVILTGGVGSRLWPLSRKSCPKQYLELFGGKSLFEMTVERNAALADKVLVVGNIDNHHHSCNVMEKFKIPHSYIIESTARNTAAAIAFAAFKSYSDDILIITPSDHVIVGKKRYKDSLLQAIALAKNNYLVTFGIKPSKPETGYGYIEFEGDDVLAFHEKPDLQTAVQFLEKGNHYWNSGLFCFKAGVYLDELQKHAPDVYDQAQKAWASNNAGLIDYNLSLQIPSISVDYAVMERSINRKVVPSTFDWSDLGSFESVYDYMIQTGHKVDANGNIVIGTSIDTYFVGLQNCILVWTSDAFLVLQKEYSQDVKQIYNHLEMLRSTLL